MALLEATEDVFQRSADIVNRMHRNVSHTIEQLNILYSEGVHKEPIQDTKTSVWLLKELGADPEHLDVEQVKQFFVRRPALYNDICKDYDENYVMRLAAVLYVYFYVSSNRVEAKARWPLTDKELSPICRHLGMTVDSTY